MGSSPKYTLTADWEKRPAVKYKHRSVSDVAVDSRDRIYLFTRNANEVLVYERDGTFVTAWGRGQFGGRAHGITVGPDDCVYCANDLDHTVRKFTASGELLMALGNAGVPSDTGYDRTQKTQLEKDASIVRAGPPFNRPTKVAVGPNGDIYVSDGYGNARVHRFSAEGRLLHSWGEPGTGPGQFMVPHGIAITADGLLLVADRENDRIQSFTLEGKCVDAWNGFSRPTSVFVHSSGWVYVTETGWAFDPAASPPVGPTALPIRLSILDAKGHFVARWESGETGEFGAFPPPHGICVDSHGDIYLASNNRRGAGGDLRSASTREGGGTSSHATLDTSLLKFVAR